MPSPLPVRERKRVARLLGSVPSPRRPRGRGNRYTTQTRGVPMRDVDEVRALSGD
jgi:hypothetical protein